jgi:hypothetical protein
MDIKYVVIKEKGIVKAYPVTKGEYAEGIDKGVAEVLVSKYGISKKTLTVPSNLVGIAKLHPDDTYNEEIGKKIARDKLLVAYNRELNKALEVYSTGLVKLLAVVHSKTNSSKNKILNAKSRLEK